MYREIIGNKCLQPIEGPVQHKADPLEDLPSLLYLLWMAIFIPVCNLLFSLIAFLLKDIYEANYQFMVYVKDFLPK